MKRQRTNLVLVHLWQLEFEIHFLPIIKLLKHYALSWNHGDAYRRKN